MAGTVAISGATGKVGKHIVQHMLKEGYAVHALTRSKLPAGHPLSNEHIAMTYMDLATLPEAAIMQWFNAIRPAAFIHSAALADVPACEQRPDLAYLMNAQVTRMLAKACAQYQTHFIMLSTEYVFGGTSHPEILHHERDQVRPLNQYGKSKAQGENATQGECSDKTPWTICRTSVVYGQTGEITSRYRLDFAEWVYMMLTQRQVLRVAADQINSPTYSPDLAKLLVAIVQLRLQGIYHAAGSTALSRYHFALKVAQHFDLDDTYIQPAFTSELSLDLQRPLNAGLCVDKITQASGIRPLSIEDGLGCLASGFSKKAP